MEHHHLRAVTVLWFVLGRRDGVAPSGVAHVPGDSKASDGMAYRPNALPGRPVPGWLPPRQGEHVRAVRRAQSDSSADGITCVSWTLPTPSLHRPPRSAEDAAPAAAVVMWSPWGAGSLRSRDDRAARRSADMPVRASCA